jgi:putative ABC transport system permease protein
MASALAAPRRDVIGPSERGMARTLGLRSCVVLLAAGLTGRGPTGGVAAGQPAAEREPTAVVVRSVRPPDAADPGATRAFVLRYGLTQTDLDACRKLDGVKHVVPTRLLAREVRHGDRLAAARIVATTEDYAAVGPVALAAGRFLRDREDQPAPANVAVLGAGVARELFPDGEPVGNSVLVMSHKLVVVGVAKAQPRPAGGAAEDGDRDMFMPLATARARFGDVDVVRRAGKRSAERVELHQILLTPTDPARLRPLADATRRVLALHHERNDWELVPR